MITLAPGPFCTFLIVAPDGRSRLIQHDGDFPGVASTFGWRMPAEITLQAIWDAYDFLDSHVGCAADTFEPHRRTAASGTGACTRRKLASKLSGETDGIAFSRKELE